MLEHLHKIVLVGESGSGKTTIVQSLQDTVKSKENVLSCAVKFVKLNDEDKKLQLVFWDTNCSSDTLLKLCLRRVEIIVFVLDAQKLQNNQEDIVTTIQSLKKLIHEFFIENDVKDECQFCIFVNKMDTVIEPIDFLMDAILFKTGINLWCFGSALANNTQSLVDLCTKMILQSANFRKQINYKWSWLEFVLRGNIIQFLLSTTTSSSESKLKYEHHIPIRMPQIEQHDENSLVWKEMEQITRQTCYDSIEQHLGTRSNIIISINKIPRPSGVEQSRFSILVSLWFDCSTKETKPITLNNDTEIEQRDETNQTPETCVIS